MVWEYLEMLRRQTRSIQDITDEKELRQTICLCILLAVTTVEAFMNLFFQVLVNKPEFAAQQASILDSLKQRRSLDYKVKNWPNELFGKGIDLTQGIGKEFESLKGLRNKLMHFTSSEDVNIEGVTLHNVSDISFYDNLTAKEAYDAEHTAACFIEEILKLSGLTDSSLQGRMLHWTGLPNAAILRAGDETTRNT